MNLLYLHLHVFMQRMNIKITVNCKMRPVFFSSMHKKCPPIEKALEHAYPLKRIIVLIGPFRKATLMYACCLDCISSF